MTERTDHWAVWLTLILCVLAFVLGAWLLPGPSETEAAADTAKPTAASEVATPSPFIN